VEHVWRDGFIACTGLLPSSTATFQSGSRGKIHVHEIGAYSVIYLARNQQRAALYVAQSIPPRRADGLCAGLYRSGTYDIAIARTAAIGSDVLPEPA
jgi:hypothetical protein